MRENIFYLTSVYFIIQSFHLCVILHYDSMKYKEEEEHWSYIERVGKNRSHRSDIFLKIVLYACKSNENFLLVSMTNY